MALLPKLDYEYNERSVTDVFLGYRRRERIGEGEFYNTRNLTSACYPLLANRKKRGRVRTMKNPGGLLAKKKLAWVEDGALWYFSYADEAHCANWRADDGWTGDSYR